MKVSSRQDGENLIIELTFDAHDQICLKHDLADIVDWYSKGPASEKIASCRKRMINENKEKLMKTMEASNMTISQANALLSDPISCCQAIRNLPDYKNRAERDASNSSQ